MFETISVPPGYGNAFERIIRLAELRKGVKTLYEAHRVAVKRLNALSARRAAVKSLNALLGPPGCG